VEDQPNEKHWASTDDYAATDTNTGSQTVF